MTPQERDLITDLFRRLRDAEPVARDREADELIRQLSTSHAGAAYLLTQTVLVQEQALTAAQTRIEELQRQVAAAAARPAESGSFLGSGLGGLFGGRRQAPPPPPPQAAPWGAAQPQQPGPWGAPQPAGGGFLQSALSTAAGVAGGALLFEGISHMFGGGAASAAPLGSVVPPPVIENTTINNYYGDQSDDSGDFDTGSDGGSFFDDV